MGSTDKAVITGFICRLCSKMNRFVIHVYGEEGERLRLAEKINAYLPITINANDPLPKTVCLPCIERLETHHELMEQFSWARQRLAQVKANPCAQVSSGGGSRNLLNKSEPSPEETYNKISSTTPMRTSRWPVEDEGKFSETCSRKI